METHQLTEEQLENALCEVRKAHRLIYEYQRRMQDLSWFIKNKLGFPLYKGYKKFSNPISRNNISYDMWAWDFIYSYVFNYFLGEQSDPEKHISWKLSVIQISDTGHFKNVDKGSTRTNTSSYALPEESESRLLFYLTVIPESDTLRELIDTNTIVDAYANSAEFGKVFSTVIDDRQQSVNKQVVYSVPISRFIDEESTIQVLRDFVLYCNDNVGTSLKIQE